MVKDIYLVVMFDEYHILWLNQIETNSFIKINHRFFFDNFRFWPYFSLISIQVHEVNYTSNLSDLSVVFKNTLPKFKLGLLFYESDNRY